MKMLFILLTGIAIAAVITAQASVSPQTLDNLNTAYQGESNAAHRYEAFAKKADTEGFAYAARLFRAAAKAEAIHRDTHQNVILELAGKVKSFKLDEVKAGPTAENLQASIKGEGYERDKMYPEFLTQARMDGAKPALRTFLYAQKAEAEHAKLYQDALDNLGKNADLPLYVCKVCGYTVTKLPANNCGSCREPVSNYERIN